MSQPSILQSLGGPLGGQKFEFRGGNAMVGSAPDCAVRLEAPGVEGYHARIVIDITGATIYRVDGPVGVNDDVVTTDALLRSGDFVWIGEPGGPTSLMFQFTLGDVEEEAAPAPAPEAAPAPAPEAAPVVAAAVEEVGPEDLPAPEPAALVEAAPAEAAPPEAPVEQQELMEMAPEPVAGPEEVLEESQPEPAPEAAEEPMLLETAPEPVQSEPAAEPVTEIESAAEIEAAFEPPPAFAQTAEVEHTFEAPAEEPAAPQPTLSPAETLVAPAETVVVPPAPWQMPAASTPEPAPAAEYASAWESPAAAPAPATPEATVDLPAAPPPAPPPPPPPPPPAPKPPAAGQTRPPRPTPSTSTVAPKRPAAPGIKIRTVEQDKALRTPPPPPPPARTTSSMPIIVGGLVVLLVVAVGGFFMLRPSPAPVAPPTPAPTPVVVSTPAPTPEATPEATQVAEVAPTPEPTPEAPAPVAPTPRVAATPAPRTTPAPRATPTPRLTPTPARPGPAAPTVAPTAVAPSAPVSQAPRLLDEARAAMTAKDLPKAAQLLGEVLRIEPGNAEAATRKAEVDGRMASLAKKFVTGVTTVIGGKTAKGPSGFDLGGGGVVKTDFSAQIRCTTTPTSVDAGASYSIRCSILNIGAKAFRIEGITVNEVADGAKNAGAGVTPRGDIAPQADAVIVERVGTWSAKGSWSLEVIAKTTKDESFRAVYSWR